MQIVHPTYDPADTSAIPSSVASSKFRLVYLLLLAYPCCTEKKTVKTGVILFSIRVYF